MENVKVTAAARGGRMATLTGPDFITILVTDLEASFEFYTKICGLIEAEEKRPRAHAFATKPCGFAIRKSPDDRPSGNADPGVIVWFHTTDATALHDELREKGVPIVSDLQRGPFGMTFSFRDPDGYTLTVHDGG